MRTDQPWLGPHQPHRQPKPPRRIEEEVVPGALLFVLGARRRLTLLATALGLAGAGAIVTTTTRRNVNVAISERISDSCCLLAPGFSRLFEEPTGNLSFGEPLVAVVPGDRRLDPPQ